MRVEINETNDVYQKIALHATQELINAKMPKTIEGKEYVAVINGETIDIFWATKGSECKCLKGSVLAQDVKGARKIGFVDIFSENVVWSVWNLICDYWQKEHLNACANQECIQKDKSLLRIVNS